MAQLVKNLVAMRQGCVRSLGWENPLEKGKATHSSIYWASLVAQTVKRLPVMRETQVRSLGQEEPLEKEMTTHSSTLAWKIAWVEKPGRLQSAGSQSRTRLSSFAFAFTFAVTVEKLEPSRVANGNVKWSTPFWKMIWQFLKRLSRESPRNPETPLRCQETPQQVFKQKCTEIFRGAAFPTEHGDQCPL